MEKLRLPILAMLFSAVLVVLVKVVVASATHKTKYDDGHSEVFIPSTGMLKSSEILTHHAKALA